MLRTGQSRQTPALSNGWSGLRPKLRKLFAEKFLRTLQKLLCLYYNIRREE